MPPPELGQGLLEINLRVVGHRFAYPLPVTREDTLPPPVLPARVQKGIGRRPFLGQPPKSTLTLIRLEASSTSRSLGLEGAAQFRNPAYSTVSSGITRMARVMLKKLGDVANTIWWIF